MVITIEIEVRTPDGFQAVINTILSVVSNGDADINSIEGNMESD